MLDGALVALAVFALLFVRLEFLDSASRHNQIEGVRAELVELARIAASQVDTALVLGMQSQQQAGSPEHLAMLAPLVRFHKASRDLMYVFVARLEGTRVRMVGGTDYLYRVPGDDLPPDPVYWLAKQPDAELVTALRTQREVVDGMPVQGPHRMYMSAYAPFFDDAGQFVGVVGVDMWVRDLETRLADLRDMHRMGLLTGLIISLLIGAGTLGVSLRLRRAWQRERELNRALTATAAELREAAERAESASRAKDDFLASMSHEIRTPINGVLGMVDLLKHTPLSDRQREYARTAKHSAGILLAILGDILDLSKAGEGKLQLHLEPFDLDEVLRSTGDVVRLQAHRKGVTVETRFPADASRYFVGDVTRIEQVLLNLASNAEKFTSQGSILIAADVVPVAEGRCRITLHVTDTGIGIAPEEQQRIFERFTQSDSAPSRRAGGAGLGLAICRTLVDLMGGSLHVESVVGMGSHFWCELELPVATVAPDVQLVAQAGTELAGGRSSCRVLVVDDNAVNRMVAVMMLRRIGCEVVEVDGGEAAVAELANGPFDAVFMDCEMPDVDGYEATRRIRAAESRGQRRTVIVAVTAIALAGDRERCLAAGMDHYLAKPISAAALATVLSRVECSADGAAPAPRGAASPGA